jgi:hypothetical protein
MSGNNKDGTFSSTRPHIKTVFTVSKVVPSMFKLAGKMPEPFSHGGFFTEGVNKQ